MKRKPGWLKVKLPQGPVYSDVKRLLDSFDLNTVCVSARCPNVGECWNLRTATFLILGNICSRSCRFCAVKSGKPVELDFQEPHRVAQAVKKLNLRHAVITSVNRDELEDGGAAIFAETIRQIRTLVPSCRIEVLTPDFKGNESALDTILETKPDIFNHNVETVPRLYQTVRPQAEYERSLHVLDYMKKYEIITKSGLMVGIGEQPLEVSEVLKELKSIAVDILTIGQYLQPTPNHLPVDRYVNPEEFLQYKNEGIKMGFLHMETGPLVRSSYHAGEQILSRKKTEPFSQIVPEK